MLAREEYVEQAHLFRTLGERLPENLPLQELLGQVKQELLSTARLPMAVDFLLAELRHAGTISTAMARLGHYFTPFQTYVIQEAEAERGRFDMRIALAILQHEADLRSREPARQTLFMYQFECLCRNRLRYDPGLTAMSQDPAYDEAWKQWLLTVRAQIGLVDFADMIYVRSEHYLAHRTRPGQPRPEPEAAVLFGEKEGKIAWANRRKDPLYLFAALQRHLGYPQVPRPKRPDESRNVLPLLLVRMERVETRLKMMEEESRRGAVDLTKFYGPDTRLPAVPPPDDIVTGGEM
jgi:hypothetical protein